MSIELTAVILSAVAGFMYLPGAIATWFMATDCLHDKSLGSERADTYPKAYYQYVEPQLITVVFAGAYANDSFIMISRLMILVPAALALMAFSDDDGVLTKKDKAVRVQIAIVVATFAAVMAILAAQKFLGSLPQAGSVILNWAAVGSVVIYFFRGQIPTIADKWRKRREGAERPPGFGLQVWRVGGFGCFSLSFLLTGSWLFMLMNAVPLIGAITLVLIYGTWPKSTSD